MPIEQVYVCPVCGARTEPIFTGGPAVAVSWISVGDPIAGIEYLDTWDCVATFAEGKVAAADADSGQTR
jgi:hypothetical protein